MRRVPRYVAASTSAVAGRANGAVRVVIRVVSRPWMRTGSRSANATSAVTTAKPQSTAAATETAATRSRRVGWTTRVHARGHGARARPRSTGKPACQVT